MPAKAERTVPLRARLPAAERKAQIVDAALRLADEHGPDALTTEMIADAIGLTQPALFRHFPRKDDIWTAVANRLCEDMAEARARAVAPGMSAPVTVVAIAVAQAGNIEATPGLASILVSREMHVRNEALRTGLAANQKALHAELAAAIADGQAKGDFRGDLDSSDAAFLVIAIVQSLALRWSLTGRKLKLAIETDRLAKLLVRGFSPLAG